MTSTVLEKLPAAAADVAALPHVLASGRIGSSTYLPDPADLDFIVLVNACSARDFGDMLMYQGCGWSWASDRDYDMPEPGLWCSLRRGVLNLMVTTDAQFFARYLRATEVCKALNLTDKDDRIMVCRIVRDGMTAAAALEAR